MSDFFIRRSVDPLNVRGDLEKRITYEDTPTGRGFFFDGVVQLDEFLSDEGRQFLEGQIFAYGADLRSVCRTVSSQHCPDEITVPSPERQLPVVGDLAQEFDAFCANLLPARWVRSAYQLRVYEPRYGGHPEHVDYAPGFAVTRKDGRASCITSLSFSLPISWNGGTAPVFRLHDAGGECRQDVPGSLVVFGPRVRHGHPAAPDLEGPYAWLIVQAFYEARLEALEAKMATA